MGLERLLREGRGGRSEMLSSTQSLLPLLLFSSSAALLYTGRHEYLVEMSPFDPYPDPREDQLGVEALGLRDGQGHRQHQEGRRGGRSGALGWLRGHAVSTSRNRLYVRVEVNRGEIRMWQGDREPSLIATLAFVSTARRTSRELPRRLRRGRSIPRTNRRMFW